MGEYLPDRLPNSLLAMRNAPVWVTNNAATITLPPGTVLAVKNWVRDKRGEGFICKLPIAGNKFLEVEVDTDCNWQRVWRTIFDQ